MAGCEWGLWSPHSMTTVSLASLAHHAVNISREEPCLRHLVSLERGCQMVRNVCWTMAWMHECRVTVYVFRVKPDTENLQPSPLGCRELSEGRAVSDASLQSPVWHGAWGRAGTYLLNEPKRGWPARCGRARLTEDPLWHGRILQSTNMY